MAEHSRIIKVAGLSFVGFCAVSVAADKLPVGINAVQIAGFCGAFAGALIGRYRKGRKKSVHPAVEVPQPKKESIEADGEVLATSQDSG